MRARLLSFLMPALPASEKMLAFGRPPTVSDEAAVGKASAASVKSGLVLPRYNFAPTHPVPTIRVLRANPNTISESLCAPLRPGPVVGQSAPGRIGSRMEGAP